ncbi:hypothetical protein [Streptomyces sp. BPTC-684]|uniref:hypothetical protein n=1 Tax=Streptomyces sp. BPTC-684 TaxID=3043734 RepID=UPI0024B19077|nr:hypothetical protein [Streptomyces sp. BPTC-684]WHM36613.1 hypothetical protein QIY60_06435 [Streptomyces sp. BPTC-684]
MARIRTIKPEAFESEDLASVSVTAMVTFFGLLTQSDDAGRFRDHPAVIAGRLWALRREHTPADVADDLEQLAQAGLICRYTGCDGKRWLHIVTWDRHQRINRPSDSRLPRCPAHDTVKACGECERTPCPAAHHDPGPAAGAPEVRDAAGSAVTAPSGEALVPRFGIALSASPTTPAAAAEVTQTSIRAVTQATKSMVTHVTMAPPVVTQATMTGVTRTTMTPDIPTEAACAPLAPAPAAPVPLDDDSAGQGLAEREGVVIGATFSEASRTGSRILDPGTSRRGREAPAPPSASEEPPEEAGAGEWSVKRLMSEYIRACPGGRAPKAFLGHLGKQIRLLVEEGYGPEVLRPALERLRAKGLHPSVLPSLVNEVLNAEPVPAPSPGWSVSSASGAGPWGHAPSPATAYTPYLNASEPTGIFGVAL